MIWLIGNKGMLGTELSNTLTACALRFIGTDRDVDITDPDALYSFAREKEAAHTPITCIVNCAAYTNVNKAESDAELCAALNVTGPKNIAKVAHKIGAVLIHVSTDYVFDGTASEPYTENMPINPTGVYGKTKAQGEECIFAETSRAYIIRTAWLYGAYGNNFVFTMMRLMNEKGAVTVVADQFGTPTFAGDLARAITDFVTRIEAENNTANDNAAPVKTTSPLPPFGIYHFTNLGTTNWYDFAREIYRIGRKTGKITRDAVVSPCTTMEFPTPAPRPKYSVLSKDKIAAVLSDPIPKWEESLEKFIASLKEPVPIQSSSAASSKS